MRRYASAHAADFGIGVHQAMHLGLCGSGIVGVEAELSDQIRLPMRGEVNADALPCIRKHDFMHKGERRDGALNVSRMSLPRNSIMR